METAVKQPEVRTYIGAPLGNFVCYAHFCLFRRRHRIQGRFFSEALIVTLTRALYKRRSPSLAKSRKVNGANVLRQLSCFLLCLSLV